MPALDIMSLCNTQPIIDSPPQANFVKSHIQVYSKHSKQGQYEIANLSPLSKGRKIDIHYENYKGRLHVVAKISCKDPSKPSILKFRENEISRNYCDTMEFFVSANTVFSLHIAKLGGGCAPDHKLTITASTYERRSVVEEVEFTIAVKGHNWESRKRRRGQSPKHMMNY
jgi:hypothetical protein